jgi:hypothetical protein
VPDPLETEVPPTQENYTPPQDDRAAREEEQAFTQAEQGKDEVKKVLILNSFLRSCAETCPLRHASSCSCSCRLDC